MDVSAPRPWARAILEQNRRWLLAYFIAGTGDAHRAEDLVQDVFAAALKYADRFDPSQSFGAWLRGIARNILLMSYRESRRRALSLSEAALDRLDAAAERAEAVDSASGHSDRRQDFLRECLKEVPERSRKILALKYAKGQPSRAIAGRTGMRVEAVDVLLSRIRRALQHCMDRKLAHE
jgi:RNA polymerase sigma-70 factor, ECF subfamily